MGINPTPTLGDRGVFRLEDGDKPHPYIVLRREDGDKPHPYIGGTLLVAKTEPDPNKPMEPHPYIGYHRGQANDKPMEDEDRPHPIH